MFLFRGDITDVGGGIINTKKSWHIIGIKARVCSNFYI